MYTRHATRRWLAPLCIASALSMGEEGCEDDADQDGWTESEGDCDDARADVYPGAPEVCNGIDDDCDGMIDEDQSLLRTSTSVTVTYYRDADLDGFGDPTQPATFSCASPVGYSDNSRDCDDTNAEVNPNARELCDGIDNDCDEQIDEDSTFYSDEDGDGYRGTPYTLPCEEIDPDGYYIVVGSDCDDTDPAVNPGEDEMCDGIDNNCDGEVDESITYYYSADHDSYGGINSPFVIACGEDIPYGYVDNHSDCDDTRSDVYPYAFEKCDGIDNDCDTEVDECGEKTVYEDTDGDGYGNPYVKTTLVAYPYCTEPAPEGWSYINGDCDDTDATVYLYAEEVCDGKDNDCDQFQSGWEKIDEGGTYWYADNDIDGFGSKDEKDFVYLCEEASYTPPVGWITSGGDCNDADASVNPNAPDETCDGVDNNCDWNDGVDADNDGYSVCENDCDDTNNDIYPMTTWIEQCNGIDDNCDGEIDNVKMYVDADGDGDGDETDPGTMLYCPLPESGWSRYPWDCNDADPTISGLNGVEINDDDIDSDCDGADNEDDD